MDYSSELVLLSLGRPSIVHDILPFDPVDLVTIIYLFTAEKYDDTGWVQQRVQIGKKNGQASPKVGLTWPDLSEARPRQSQLNAMIIAGACERLNAGGVCGAGGMNPSVSRLIFREVLSRENVVKWKKLLWMLLQGRHSEADF